MKSRLSPFSEDPDFDLLLPKLDKKNLYMTAATPLVNSTANKYYSSASHHEQKNKKTTGQIKFSVVTVKQWKKLHFLYVNEC